MADVLLSVPYVTQVNIGAKAGIGGGRTENMGCWYAAVQMLGYFREAGPRLGVPEQYMQADGKPRLDAKGELQPLGMGANYPKLVQNEALSTIPLPADNKWTAAKLADLLADCGPIYMRTKVFGAGGVFLGGHILVLIGAKTSSNTVVVHDPAVGPSVELSIDSLNARFNWDKTAVSEYSMMYKPPAITTRARSNAFSSPASRPRMVIGGHR